MSRRKSQVFDLNGFPAKKCIDCNEIKKFTEFYIALQTSTGVGSRCKECTKKKWSEDNKSYRTPEYRRNNYLRNAYGINQDDYLKMYTLQSGKCAICLRFFENLDIDHNEQTGIIRELLCENCNVGIGNLQHNILILENAIRYLKKWDISNDE